MSRKELDKYLFAPLVVIVQEYLLPPDEGFEKLYRKYAVDEIKRKTQDHAPLEEELYIRVSSLRSETEILFVPKPSLLKEIHSRANMAFQFNEPGMTLADLYKQLAKHELEHKRECKDCKDTVCCARYNFGDGRRQLWGRIEAYLDAAHTRAKRDYDGHRDLIRIL